MSDESPTVWWGEFELPVGRAGRWRVGPLTVWLRHCPREWRLAHASTQDRAATDLEVLCPAEDLEPPPADAHVERLMSDSPGDRVTVAPALADRQVLTRPEGDCWVLAGARLNLYVSTPLWMRIESESGRLLLDQAMVRPTDSFFGPTTRAGEICYASHTPACLELDELPLLPFRAVTRVRVENRGEDLELKRLALPAPNLALYTDRARPETGLWTSAVTLERHGDGETVRVDVERRPPADLETPQRVAGPRSAHGGNVLARAMSSILS